MIDPAEAEELRIHAGLTPLGMKRAIDIANSSPESVLVAVVRLLKDNADMQAELTRLRGGRKRRPKSSPTLTR